MKIKDWITCPRCGHPMASSEYETTTMTETIGCPVCAYSRLERPGPDARGRVAVEKGGHGCCLIRHRGTGKVQVARMPDDETRRRELLVRLAAASRVSRKVTGRVVAS